jgi:hypothetical protein
MPISARGMRTPKRHHCLEIAKFTPRADSTAGDLRSRESGHRTPMPCGTTRHQ